MSKFVECRNIVEFRHFCHKSHFCQRNKEHNTLKIRKKKMESANKKVANASSGELAFFLQEKGLCEEYARWATEKSPIERLLASKEEAKEVMSLLQEGKKRGYEASQIANVLNTEERKKKCLTEESTKESSKSDEEGSDSEGEGPDSEEEGSDSEEESHCMTCGHLMGCEWGTDTESGIDFDGDMCDDCCCGACGCRKAKAGKECC